MKVVVRKEMGGRMDQDNESKYAMRANITGCRSMLSWRNRLVALSYAIQCEPQFTQVVMSPRDLRLTSLHRVFCAFPSGAPMKEKVIPEDLVSAFSIIIVSI